MTRVTIAMVGGVLAAFGCGSSEPDCDKVASHLEGVAKKLGEGDIAGVKAQVAKDCKEEKWPADVRSCMVTVEDKDGFKACLSKHPAFPLAQANDSEARAMIKKLYDGARAYYLDAPDSGGLTPIPPQFPGESVGPTPPLGECCKQGGKCAPNGANWEAPTWSALQFSVHDPHQYSYQYEVIDPAKKFVVRAFGDLDCDGSYATFEMTGEIGAASPDGPSGSPELKTVNLGE